MTQHVRKTWTRLFISIVALALSSAAHGTGMSIRQLGAEQLRLATIGYRLSAANARACTDPQMLSGLVLHDLTQYQLSARAAVSKAFSLKTGVGILEVVPHSVADEAGLRMDDEILAVGGKGLEDASAVGSSSQSYNRIYQITAIIDAALRAGTTDLLIRRGAQILQIGLSGQAGCGGHTLLLNSPDLNAWSDGSNVIVTRAMMRFAGSDDQLAFIVAHEMAHNILRHSTDAKPRGLLGLFGFGSLRVRRQEIAADEAAVPLMSSGGYRPNAAVEILHRAQNVLWWDLSIDHPGFGQRIRTVTAAIARSAPASTWDQPRLFSSAHALY